MNAFMLKPQLYFNKNVKYNGRISNKSSTSSTKIKAYGRFKTPSQDEQYNDYYDLLEVDTDATIGEIKFNYRKLQKQYHPDISGNQDISSELNKAYQTLIDPGLRSQYDRHLSTFYNASGIIKRNNKDKEGLVGPFTAAELIYQITIDSVKSKDNSILDLIDWIREWAKTFIFAAEIPLPTPIQCDDIEDGARLAFLTANSGRIKCIGELLFLVQDDEINNKAIISIKRILKKNDFDIPGEDRVLRSFKNAIADKKEMQEEKKWSFDIKGIMALGFAQMLPALPIFPGEKITGSSYAAYHLKRKHP